MDKFHSQEEFELIEGYLNESIDPQKQEEVRLRISSDEDFSARVRDFSELQMGVERAALGSRLDSFHSEINNEKSVVPIRKLNAFQFWGVAASFFLIITAGIWWMMAQKSPGEKLYLSYFRPDPGLVTSMSGESNYEFDRAMVDYKEGNYTEAIIRWEKLLADKPKSDTLSYFLGSAYLSAEEESRSLDYLESVARDSESAFYSDANWYAGLAALKLGQNEKSLNFLRASFRPEAKKLISELESK